MRPPIMMDSANVVVEAIPRLAPVASASGKPYAAGTGASLLSGSSFLSSGSELYVKEERIDCAGEITVAGEAVTTSSDEDDDRLLEVNMQAGKESMYNESGFVLAHAEDEDGNFFIEANAEHSNCEEEEPVVFVEVPEDDRDKVLFNSAAPTQEDGRFQCQVCGKSFLQSTYLRVHMRTHEGVKPYKCKECGKCFARASLLTEHKRLHEESLHYTCHICGKCYRWNSSLHLHMQTHSNTKDHVCKICKRQFRWRISLRRHMTEHSAENPHKCETCKKGFSDKYTLEQHLRVHTGERPFKCPDCGRSFRWRHQITQHACAKRFEEDGSAPKRSRRSTSAPSTGDSASKSLSSESQQSSSKSSSAGTDAVSTSTASLEPPPAKKTRRPRRPKAKRGTSNSSSVANTSTPTECSSSVPSGTDAINNSTAEHNSSKLKARIEPSSSAQPSPILFSIANASGSDFTGRLSNFSSESTSNELRLSADIVEASGASSSEQLLSSTSAEGRIAVDENGQRKLVLTLPKSVALALLATHLSGGCAEFSTSLPGSLAHASQPQPLVGASEEGCSRLAVKSSAPSLSDSSAYTSQVQPAVDDSGEASSRLAGKSSPATEIATESTSCAAAVPDQACREDQDDESCVRVQPSSSSGVALGTPLVM